MAFAGRRRPQADQRHQAAHIQGRVHASPCLQHVAVLLPQRLQPRAGGERIVEQLGGGSCLAGPAQRAAGPQHPPHRIVARVCQQLQVQLILNHRQRSRWRVVERAQAWSWVGKQPSSSRRHGGSSGGGTLTAPGTLQQLSNQPSAALG